MASLPARKRPLRNLPPRADPTQYGRAADINGLLDALTGAGDAITPKVSGGTVLATGSTTARTLAERAHDGPCVLDWRSLVSGGDWTAAVQAALTAVPSTGGSVLFPPGTYTTTAPVSITPTTAGVTLIGYGATIQATHNGAGLILDGNAPGGNWDGVSGYHRVIGLTVSGPNTHFPPDGTAAYHPSTSAGIRMKQAFHNILRDVTVMGFDVGAYLQNGIGNQFEGKTYFRWNQYGVQFDGGATNANKFFGTTIRENRKFGVYFSGANSAPYPTANVFVGCHIESNIPYEGGYLSGGRAPSDSIGVYVAGYAYDNLFVDCYSENQQYAVWLKGPLNGNRFLRHRSAASADYSRLDAIKLDGASVYDNTFTEWNAAPRRATSADSSDILVESSHADQLRNVFENCTGLTFIGSSILAPLLVRWNRLDAYGHGLSVNGSATTVATGSSGSGNIELRRISPETRNGFDVGTLDIYNGTDWVGQLEIINNGSGTSNTSALVWWLNGGSGLKKELVVARDNSGASAANGLQIPDQVPGTALNVGLTKVTTGAPSNSYGQDGDFCFRKDGTAAGKTCLYHKEGGSWVALVP